MTQHTIKIADKETALKSWARDVFSFALALALIGVGVWLQSTAMQWLGAIVFFIISISRGASLIKTMTIQEAREYLDELEKPMTNNAPELKLCPFCGEHLISPYLKHPDVYKHPEGTDCYAGKAIVYPEHYAAWNTRADLAVTVKQLAWQPIDTAPKDEWLVFHWQEGCLNGDEMPPDLRTGVGKIYGDRTNLWLMNSFDNEKVWPTHWMPLPKPPALAELTGGKHD